MPTPTLSPDWREFQRENNRLDALIVSVGQLTFIHRKLVAEIAMIRLFLLIENTIASIGAKILCGANYLDGSTPRVLVAANTVPKALALMKGHNRRTPKPFLSWTKSKDIRDNLKHTLDAGDSLFACVIRHGIRLNEMRIVRNHIAHGSESTAVKFRSVIRAHYGGLKKGMTPGLLLLTPALGHPPLIERYFAYSRVMIKEMVRA